MTEGAALAALDELPVSGDGVEDAPLRQETAVGDVVTRSAPADSLEKASSVSGVMSSSQASTVSAVAPVSAIARIRRDSAVRPEGRMTAAAAVTKETR